jgi:sporulation protein YlmC with PRC-barrel domain
MITRLLTSVATVALLGAGAAYAQQQPQGGMQDQQQVQQPATGGAEQEPAQAQQGQAPPQEAEPTGQAQEAQPQEAEPTEQAQEAQPQEAEPAEQAQEAQPQEAEPTEQAQEQEPAEPAQEQAQEEPAEDQQQTAAASVDFIKAQEEGQMRADELIGTDVVNASDEELGEIEDLLITKDQGVVGVVVGVGGFLGIGTKNVAVPVEALTALEEDRVLIEMTREQLEEAPDFATLDEVKAAEEAQQAQQLQQQGATTGGQVPATTQ